MGSYLGYVPRTNQDIRHFGVKGMKWGVRRAEKDATKAKAYRKQARQAHAEGDSKKGRRLNKKATSYTQGSQAYDRRQYRRSAKGRATQAIVTTQILASLSIMDLSRGKRSVLVRGVAALGARQMINALKQDVRYKNRNTAGKLLLETGMKYAKKRFGVHNIASI